MSVQTRCDSCDKVLYPKETPVTVMDIRVTNIYDKTPCEYQCDLCKPCSMKVALALKPYLPHLAYKIEPNAANRLTSGE